MMNKKDNDPFGFNKAINWDKLEDPKVIEELQKLFAEKEEKEDQAASLTRKNYNVIQEVKGERNYENK